MTVELRSGESQESLVKRFRKAVGNSRILSEYKKRRWFVSKGELRRKQRKRVIRKARRGSRQRRSRDKGL